MKRISIVFLLLCLTAINAVAQRGLPDPKSPPVLVNDFTGKMLSREQVAALEQKLVAYDDSTSNQIVVLIVDDLKGYSAADYAMGVGRKWGVGNKNFNNGVVLLISTGGAAGSRDAFIAVGYGLEGVITDLVSDAILDNELIPGLSSGNYFGGINVAVDALIRAAEGRYKAPQGYQNRKRGKGSPVPVVVIIVVMIILISRSKKGGGGGMLSRRGYGGWPGGFGGFGGGFGGGGGGGGGFGGFGGGGFGGGGAGGKW